MKLLSKQEIRAYFKPEGTGGKFLAKLLPSRLAPLEYRVERLKIKLAKLDRVRTWTPEMTSYRRKLGDTLAALGRLDEAKKEYGIYLEKLMEQYAPYYNDEIKICRLIPDMHSPMARRLVRYGKYSEAAALYRQRAEEYTMVGNMNVLCLPEKEFIATKRTNTYSGVDLFLMGAADAVVFELNQMRTERRCVIAGIGLQRAEMAKKHADSLEKEAAAHPPTQA